MFNCMSGLVCAKLPQRLINLLICDISHCTGEVLLLYTSQATARVRQRYVRSRFCREKGHFQPRVSRYQHTTKFHLIEAQIVSHLFVMVGPFFGSWNSDSRSVS